MYVIQAERPATVAFMQTTVGITFRIIRVRTTLAVVIVVVRAVSSVFAVIVAVISACITAVVRT